MATAHTCKTPEEGWLLYGHFLGNLFMIIGFSANEIEKADHDPDILRCEKLERQLSETHAKLVGYLYIIMRRMIENGHDETASRMQRIIHMAVEQDLTDPSVRDAIYEEFKRLKNI